MSIMFNFIASRTQFELIKIEGYISMEKTIQYAKEKNICKKVQLCKSVVFRSWKMDSSTPLQSEQVSRT
jgi:hypothetical protein